MIVDWLAAWPSLLAAIAVIFLPGLGIGFFLRLRGLALWALAPAASIVVLSVLAIALGAVGIAWSPLSAGIGCVLVIALAFALGRLVRSVHLPPAVASRGWLLPTALVVGAILGLIRVVLYVGEPDAISQTNDAVFHLNALRWIAESGSASSFDLSQVTGSRLFYPAAWHAVASLTAMASGAAIPVAVNMVSLVIAVVVWPLGITWLAREASGSTAVAAAAAVLSSALIGFPMLMLEWGVLYPNLVSVAVLPAAVGVVVAAPRWIAAAGTDGSVRAAILIAVLLVGALGAVAFAQPATLLAWLVLAVSFFSWWALPWAMRRPARRRAVVAAVAGAWLIAIALWFLLSRQTTGSHWPPFEGKLEVLADVLLNGPVMLPFAVGVSVLMVVGLVRSVIEPRLRWLATSWLILSALYIVTASIGQPFLRRWLVGAWYADPYRMAALAPVVVIPLAAIGLAWLIGLLVARLRAGSAPEAEGHEAASGPGSVTGWLTAAVASVVVIVGLVVAPVVMMPRVIENEWDEESRYASGPDSWLSPDERSILEELSGLVPDDARVIGNPSTGSGFGYMLSGRDVFPRTWAHPRTAEWQLITESLRDAGSDPAVCDALEAYGSPEYVLDFGEGEATPGRFVLPGMTGFEGRPGFELIAREGDASLWRLTACG